MLLLSGATSMEMRPPALELAGAEALPGERALFSGTSSAWKGMAFAGETGIAS